MPKKILVIRFSSIGDIVLTSPVIRCLKQNNYEVHLMIKEKFLPVVSANPYIDKIHFFKDVSSSIKMIKEEKFDFIVDLQNNYKSRMIRVFSGIPNDGFPKLNLQKLLVVWFKIKSILPKKSIVDRYFKAVKKLGVTNDGKGLDFFIDEEKVGEKIKTFPTPYVAIVAGGSYYTKKIPLSKLREICIQLSDKKIVLLGDNNDRKDVEELVREFNNVINFCGELNLFESAYLIKNASFVVTSDTGLMHIAAAFKKKIYSLWGNTIPEFGMYPYLAHPESKILENNNLWCRPCSKLGYNHCPLGHFNCMNDIDVSGIE